MKTNEFLSILNQNTTIAIMFDYALGKLVAAYYHITEIKNISIDTHAFRGA